MKNYSTLQLKNMTVKEVRDKVYNFYRDNIQGSNIVNIQTGITIFFNKEGRHKTASLNASIEKSIVIIHLKELLKNATRIKTTEVKKGSVLYKKFTGAMYVINFSIKCKIDGAVKKFICGVVMLNTGKFQYSLYHNQIRAKK